ncbi:VWA domain-containing protein [Sedimentitalea sp. JM2-8]|uniref:VWA domain-containing protein n=1 Tax=Sedimentitalea xiamensis TaxID=3050037 RepID=A0ABT7FEG5_9RHOB|nr:VWA domain-containing protein [Sedimentitalea xiamensis]MDK3073510.1 VWA domain-containing protein [Sedimentitalea xiamensis]
MSRVTRFAAADPGPAARVAGFIGHLRDNGFRLGVGETGTALAALCRVDPTDPAEARLALKAVCTGCAEDAARFDTLFDAYWMADGRVRQKIVPRDRAAPPAHTRNSRADDGLQSAGRGRAHAPDDAGGDGQGDSGGPGRLVASRLHNLMRKDLRELVSPEDIRAAEQVARQLGRALRDRRSHRRKAARKGSAVDFRRTLRASLATGGEPLRLARRRRPDRPVKIVALCDVSGSMTLYARPFLAFLAGLMRADADSDAYLFHTRLVRIAEALRDPDPLRALNRITLLADGFGGGSRIGGNLAAFAQGHARRFVNGRSVVVILSDGYDSDPPMVLDAALARLRKRGCRIVWLNPLKGWSGYEPVARGMAAALPHLDHFAAAATLNDLAALEQALARL